VLHHVIRAHLGDFLREASERGDGRGLPDFIEREFRDFLTCGVLARGFARVRCEGYAFERLQQEIKCDRNNFTGANKNECQFINSADYRGNERHWPGGSQ
jgi:hypothetical protein